MLCYIFYRYQIDIRVLFTTWEGEIEDSARQELFILVAKTIKSALKLPLSSGSNSNKDIKVLLSSLYMNR